MRRGHRRVTGAVALVVGGLALTAPPYASAAATLPAPTQLASSPSTAASGHWIGLTQQLTLSAVVTSPAPSVHGDVQLRDATTQQVVFAGATGDVSGSGQVSVVAASAQTPLVDGHRYTWKVRADDGASTSPWVAGQAFSYDALPPTVPDVTSIDFPAVGTGTPTHHVGQSGTVDLSAQDPVGPSGRGSGLARIEWQLGTPFGGGGPPRQGVNQGSTRSASATITLTPSQWGTNVLYVRSVDRSGNTSQTRTYSFTVLS